jgi:hypothetical protein
MGGVDEHLRPKVIGGRHQGDYHVVLRDLSDHGAESAGDLICGFGVLLQGTSCHALLDREVECNRRNYVPFNPAANASPPTAMRLGRTSGTSAVRPLAEASRARAALFVRGRFCYPLRRATENNP